MVSDPSSRPFGCNCGPAKNSTKHCRRAQVWLDALFPSQKVSEISFADVGMSQGAHITLAELQDFHQLNNMTDSLDEMVRSGATLQDDMLQIHKDVCRTFPESSYFYSSDRESFTKGQAAMHQVLSLFTKYDSQVSNTKCGYV